MPRPRSSGPHRLRYIPPRGGPGTGPHPYCEACRRRLLAEGRLRRMPPWADAYLDGFPLCRPCLGRADLQKALVGGADLAGWLGPAPPRDVWERESDRLWLEACEAETARWGRYVPAIAARETALRARLASFQADVRTWNASPEADLEALADLLTRWGRLDADLRAWNASVKIGFWPEPEVRARAAFIEAYLLHGPPAPSTPLDGPPPVPTPVQQGATPGAAVDFDVPAIKRNARRPSQDTVTRILDQLPEELRSAGRGPTVSADTIGLARWTLWNALGYLGTDFYELCSIVDRARVAGHSDPAGPVREYLDKAALARGFAVGADPPHTSRTQAANMPPTTTG